MYLHFIHVHLIGKKLRAKSFENEIMHLRLVQRWNIYDEVEMKELESKSLNSFDADLVGGFGDSNNSNSNSGNSSSNHNC